MAKNNPIAISAMDAALRARPTVYPELFVSRMDGRTKRPLGDIFRLSNFGVNVTTLAPGAEFALLHSHSCQDEFVCIVAGTPTLVTESAEQLLWPGMCAGFPAGWEAHQLHNRSAADVVCLEIGDRTPGDAVDYPRDDIRADMDASGKWVSTRNDGSLG